jgi:cytochrome c5
MKRFSSLKPRLRAGAGLAMVAAALYAGSLVFVTGAETKPEKDAKSEKKTEKKADKPAAKKKLSGAELYAINCNRCHNERYPTEFTAAQWKTIMLEMRVRANLPAAQAKTILKYLQEDSGTP